MLEGIKRICNLGTGTIGPGIALTFALAGYHVNMYGRSNASIKRGFKRIDEILQRFNDHGLVETTEIPVIMARISGVMTLEEAMAGANFVIESITEDLSSKQEIFAKIEKFCSPETVFASSTSGLSPTAIAAKLEHKNRFVVAHFWNPPHLIPLVEVVPGEHTSRSSIVLTIELLKKIGKKPVVLNREALGFIGNRLQFAMLREALSIIDSGIASKEAVDATMKYALGRRLSTTGPFESADLSGLDIIGDISSYLLEDLCTSHEVSPVLRKAIAEGKLGAKTDSGFYQWSRDSVLKITRIREDNLIEWLSKDKQGYLDWEV
ncbi:3-hydroxyacyl-CoA dehydrogenase family protein [Desulfosporosinus sp.]|uniref:3-hydroxyacyl-CoA dehydrogenase family protein n=1 Tax=Desulfosporosinus sp. TaxID=157907 RepID=UPI0025C050E0|nr:3-hydroxyacyl-CoA dehydrogenase family protein [Desulfosporosinus sp.]MBC2724706.1 3-hydroxyacyl-CoA dehydrogenase family protein [Desulfosporosinus sp.]MBC2726082.1 3-hydroxyacyl-CoA dehydrogenase family protein [Desulfosporosinus sp.]